MMGDVACQLCLLDIGLRSPDTISVAWGITITTGAVNLAWDLDGFGMEIYHQH